MKVDIKRRQKDVEDKYREQITFMVLLAAARAMRNNRVSQDRVAKILEQAQDEIIELSKYLTTNTCIYKGGREGVDTVYNIHILEGLAAEVGMTFDEALFNVRY